MQNEQIIAEVRGHVFTRRQADLALSRSYTVACALLLSKFQNPHLLADDALRQTELEYYEEACPEIWALMREWVVVRAREIEREIRQKIQREN